ncbi:hypothetical protein GmHk_16G047359 [Glycine max]|nr:hypothetical protein GmHk_16G047359 [Glycine max]
MWKWKGHVRELGFGKFGVYFGELKEMTVFPKEEQLRDRISELHDSVLLLITSFMDTKDVLLRNLYKHLTNLTYINYYGCKRHACACFKKFVSWVLSILIQSWTKDYDLDRIMQYAMRHNVPQLTITCLNRTFN